VKALIVGPCADRRGPEIGFALDAIAPFEIENRPEDERVDDHQRKDDLDDL
jgi:hypothetical protein